MLHTACLVILVGIIFRLISIDLQIEKYKKSVDSRGQFDQLEVKPRNENQESDNVEYNMSTGRILTGMLIVIFFGVLVLLVKFAKSYSYDFHIVRLIGSNIVMFILQIVIPLIIIVRSENVCVFFKNQILKFFKLCTMYKKSEP